MASNLISHHHLDLDDPMVLISQYYSGVYTQLVPEQGEAKPRRRRRRSKHGGGGAEMRKGKLSDEQVKLLEESFGDEHKLETARKEKLASELGLDPRQVAVWFQNRRARWKSKRIEEEYSKLKSQHDTAIVEKCQLESEVLKLKEQLSDAEKKIQKLLGQSDGISSGSPSSSSFSMEPTPYFLQEFAMEGFQPTMEGFDNVFYVPQWANHYI